MHNGFHLPDFGDLERRTDEFTPACLQLRKGDAVIDTTPF
jgi:hypothetical protein